MAFFLAGNIPINSTFAQATDPSTAALLAELDSSNFQVAPTSPARMYGVNIYLGGSTGALWVVEHARSTNVASSAVVDRVFLRTASGQTSQFVHNFRLTATTDRIRVRMPSSLSGTFDAKLSAQEIS
jgi:hypothetical protein